MRGKNGLKVLTISIALVMVASSVVVYSGTDVEKGMGEGGGSGVISLMPPPFIGATNAAEMTGGGGAFPEYNAGISAYVNTSREIDLNKLKTIYTEVEEVGDNYIIGKTPISNFGGNIDVHVYADTSGWIVAYFKAAEPAAKIMQWTGTDVDNPSPTITTTTLRDALRKAGTAAEVAIPDTEIKYYDFAYPNANAMTIFVRTRATDGTNIVQVEIPANYTLYDASYYHYITCAYYGYGGVSSNLKVDGTTINALSVGCYECCREWNRAFGSYGGHIMTGTLHKIEISYSEDHSGSAGVATVLIYRTA